MGKYSVVASTEHNDKHCLLESIFSVYTLYTVYYTCPYEVKPSININVGIILSRVLKHIKIIWH